MTYRALYALQHRGQESCGMAINDDGVISGYKDVGLVSDVFTKGVLRRLPRGSMAIGHCRYGTTGGLHARERPAHSDTPHKGRHGSRPQRQPHERERAARGARAPGRDILQHLGQRGHKLCDNPREAAHRLYRGRRERRDEPPQRRLLPRRHEPAQAHRRPRPAGLPPLMHRASCPAAAGR